MTHMPITPDDPRLTAYVLGELDDADRAAVETALAADPACRQAVDEMTRTTAVLFEALQAEPAPVLNDNQRQAIHRAAVQPAPRRAVRVHEPAATGRRGILPLLAATIACAALLIGISAWDFERSTRQTAALFDDAEHAGRLLASHDPVAAPAAVDEFYQTELDRVTRLDALSRPAGADVNFKKELQDLSRESRELGRTIVASDGETPNVTMSLEQAESSGVQPIRLQHRDELTNEQLQGLATTTTRPSAPGNMGNVVDPSVDYLQNEFSKHGGSTPAAGTPIGPAGRPYPPAAQPAGSTSGGYGEYDGGALGAKGPPAGGQPQTRMANPSDPAAPQQQGGPSHFFRYDASSSPQPGQQAGEQSSGVSPTTRGLTSSEFATEAKSASDGFGTAAIAPATPAPVAAGMEPQLPRLSKLSVADPYGASPAGEAGGSSRKYFDRGEALHENLAAPEQRGGQAHDAEGLWLDLDFDGSTRDTAAQFVPFFAISNLQRLAEQAPAPDASAIAAGDQITVEGVPPVVSNGMTVQQDLLLGAGPATEDELRQLHEQNESSRGRTLSRFAVTWDAERWFAISPDGKRLAINVPGTEAYAPIQENEFVSPGEQPLSTFGLDVDTASYANVRRFLMDERRFPPPNAVRIEELVNYFAYSDPQPAGGEPVGVSLEASACPWNAEHRLVRIGVKAREIDLAERPPTTLVFLIDTSGSMRDDNKLPLVKDSLRILVNEMTENDRIAIVTYSSNAGLLLDSTSGEHRHEILAAIEGLHAGGSTNGEAGLKLAYEIAERHFIKHGQNRVICCTDGDFNVGTSATDPLVRMISNKRDTGVFLSICGYGTGNIKDEKLERIADTGNGQYHYVDNLKEARKVFLDELTGTLYTVAKDVKLQVEFNPARVASYRLIGYENRTMAAEDFNNDRVDSGDMGAGHSVTALYEVVPVGVEPAKPARETPGVDPLKYQRSESPERRAESEEPLTATQRGAPVDATDDVEAPFAESAELLTVKLRYKQPDGDESVKREFPLVDDAQAAASIDLQWSAAVASFGMLLRSSRHAGGSSLDGVLEMAQSAKGRDESGRRREFIDMVLQTRSLVRRLHGSPIPTPRELSSTEARQKATVGGKYEELLDKFEARGDAERYGEFHEYGWSADKSHAGRSGLPAGYWVYVYPDWYIWGETVSAARE